MRSWIVGTLSATALLAAPVVASASSLQVSPINVEIPAPGAASAVTVENLGTDNVNAQIRIFKWIQKDGKDEMVPTKEVVASPPAVKLKPGKKTVVRIVRTSKTPAAAEETYRLIVDEVPKPPKVGQAGVGFSVRYSIPVFFSKPGEDVNLSWKATVVNGKLVLQANNDGGRRVRIAGLKVVNGAGKSINISQGLAGYVLGQSSKRWVVKGGKSLGAGGKIKIIAQGDNGPIEATARVVAAN